MSRAAGGAQKVKVAMLLRRRYAAGAVCAAAGSHSMLQAKACAACCWRICFASALQRSSKQRRISPVVYAAAARSYAVACPEVLSPVLLCLRHATEVAAAHRSRSAACHDAAVKARKRRLQAIVRACAGHYAAYGIYTRAPVKRPE